MGYVIIDNRASGGDLVERNTRTCHRCGAIIEYESRPVGNFLRKFRIYKREKPDHTFDVREVPGGEFACNRHNGVVCIWCAEEMAQIGQACVSMEQRAEATVTALARHIDVWSQGGQLYIENLLNKKVY